MSEILSLVNQKEHSNAVTTSEIGQIGEEFAAKFLQKNNYRLIMSNFKVPIGRNRRGVAISGEIDLVALDSDCLCFIEVKTRSSDEFASPLSAIDIRKQRQITRTARVYRKIFHLQTMKFRFDAVSIILKQKSKPQIDLIKNFWNENKFRKKFWLDDF